MYFNLCLYTNIHVYCLPRSAIDNKLVIEKNKKRYFLHACTYNLIWIHFTVSEETVEEAIETAAEGGMLDDLYSILTNTKGETQSKVIQILAELAKVGEYRQIY